MWCGTSPPRPQSQLVKQVIPTADPSVTSAFLPERRVKTFCFSPHDSTVCSHSIIGTQGAFISILKLTRVCLLKNPGAGVFGQVFDELLAHTCDQSWTLLLLAEFTRHSVHHFCKVLFRVWNGHQVTPVSRQRRRLNTSTQEEEHLGDAGYVHTGG